MYENEQNNELFFDSAATKRNPDSLHLQGQEALDDLKKMTLTIRSVFKLPGSASLCFDSGATEGNTSVIEGIVFGRKEKSRPHLVVSRGCHESVLLPSRRLEFEKRAKISVVDLRPNGEENYEKLLDALTQNTRLLSVSLANNETGVVCDRLSLLHEECSRRGVAVHVDLTAAVGKMPIEEYLPFIDIGVLGASKFGGPEQFGIHFVKEPKKTPLRALIPGGKRERGGTLSIRRIEHFMKMLRMSTMCPESCIATMQKLRDSFEDGFRQRFGDDALIFGASAPTRLPNISFCFAKSSPMLFPRLRNRGVCFSIGSACTYTRSHVLKSMGVPETEARLAARLSFSPLNKQDEIQQLLEMIDEAM